MSIMIQVGKSHSLTFQTAKNQQITTPDEQRKERSTFKVNNQMATRMTISQEARAQFKELNFILKDSDEANPLQDSYQKINKEEAIAEVKAMAEARAKERAERHPFDDDLITYQLIEGSFAHNIASALEGKLENSSVYAVQLEKALSASNGSIEDIKTKAIQREVALQHAQYIADHYFENEVEAQAFLSEVEARAEKAALYERGYTIHEGEVYRNYISPMDNGRVSFNELAKRYMDEEYYERFISGKGTAEESKAFLLDIQKNEQKYHKEIATEFEENEKLITEQQNYAKGLVSNIEWTHDNFIQEIESALQNLGYETLAKWNLDMLNLFK